MSEEPPPRPDRDPGPVEPPPTSPATDGPPPATWSPWQALPLYAIALVVGGLGAAIASAALRPSCGGTAAVSTLIGELAFGVVTVGWVVLVNHSPPAALGLRPRRPFGDLGVGLGAGVILIVLGALAEVVVQHVARLILGHAPVQPTQVPACATQGGWLVLTGIAVCLAAPLGEETFFRGFLYQGIHRYWSVWPSALVSGALFGGAHLYPTLVPALFVVGTGLALVYQRRRSLLASMTAHATFNVFGFVMIAMAHH